MVAPDGRASSSSSFIHIHALPPSLRLTILNANTSSHGGPAPPQPGRQCKPSPRPETCMIEPVSPLLARLRPWLFRRHHSFRHSHSQLASTYGVAPSSSCVVRRISACLIVLACFVATAACIRTHDLHASSPSSREMMRRPGRGIIVVHRVMAWIGTTHDA